MNEPCPVCPNGDMIPLAVPQKALASQVNYVTSHGGSTQQVFRHIAASIPPGEGRPEDRNGSLEFPYEHPEIDGYTRDPSNPRLQHPTWPPCACRAYKITLKAALKAALKNSLTTITGVCHHLTAELKGQTVLSAQCRECPSRTPPREQKMARSPARIVADFLADSATSRTANSPSRGGPAAL